MNIHLLTAIKRAKLRQWELSKRTGISESRISKIINEIGHPPKEFEKKIICRILNAEISELFSLSTGAQ